MTETIEELKEKIREIKSKNKWQTFYKQLRSESASLLKTPGSNEEKKQMIVAVCKNTIKMIEESD